jgi:acyl-coenzyme A synthetase/AMP-(fatty) acid ligase
VLVDSFDPIGLQDCVARERASLLGAVPVMYERMLAAGLAREKLASLRFAFSAGSALGVETIERYWQAGIRLQQGYGQTETSILCCLDSADALRKAGSVGGRSRSARASPTSRAATFRPARAARWWCAGRS